MAGEILINRKNTSVVLHATSNTTWVVAGNNSVSNLTADATEIVVGAGIAQIWFGSPSGNSAYWVVKRGANVVGVFDSTTYLDFAGSGCSLNKDRTANVVVELVGSANGFIMIELQKLGSQYDYVQS